MGWLAAIARTLGFEPPLVPRDPEPLALTHTAKVRLDLLPEGRVLRVLSVPIEGGYTVRTVEGPKTGSAPPDPTLPHPRLAMAPADRDRLKGLTLDWADERWAVRLSLRVDPRETPNPDGRVYAVDRPLAVGRPAFFLPEDELPPLARRVLAIPGVASALFRDNTVTVNKAPDADWRPLDRAVDASLREHFLACGDVVRGDLGPDRSEGLAAEIERVLAEEVAPKIHLDGGDVTLVDVRDGVVRVQLTGACHSCPASTMTLKVLLERTLMQAFPGRVVKVEAT